MRRLASMAAFTLVLAIPLWGQRGGGGHVGGGHFGGGSVAHVGSVSRGSFGGGHIGGSHAAPSRGFAPHSGFSSRGFTSFSGRGPLRDNFRGHRFGDRWGYNRWGYNRWGRGYPYWGWGYYDPYWWWDNDSPYDQDYEQNYDRALEMNQQSLEQQRMLRQEEADGDQDAYAPSYAPPRTSKPANDDPQPAALMPPTVLVFRDQHKQEVQNYAIVGQTLWSFAPQHTQKIPLSELDLQATTKANEDQGVTFHVPGAEQAQ